MRSMPRTCSIDHQRRSKAGVWLGLTLLIAALQILCGCATQRITCSPSDLSGCVIDEMDVKGNDALGDDEILSRIATTETGTFLEGIPLLGAVDALTVQYERFDRFVLERDLARVERLYRAKGYYEAVVRAGRVRRIDKHKDPADVKTARLLVEIVVEEGPAVKVRGAKLAWTDWDATHVAEADAGAAAEDAKATLKAGEPFREEDYEKARLGIQHALTDLGFAYAQVEPSAEVNVLDHSADVTYTITLGPRCTFGKVEIVGLAGLPEWQVRPALGFEQGERYSTSKLEAAEIALSDFGVFGSIAIEPLLATTTEAGKPAAPREVVPIRVRVQPAALGAVRLGGGLEIGDQVAARAVAGWQHKNASGALDRFNIEARPRLVFYPWRLTTLFGEIPALIPEISLRLQYTLPFPFDPKSSLFVQSQASIGLPANDTPPRTLAEDPGADIVGEYLLEHRQGIERRFFSSRFSLSLSHNLSFSSPFIYPRSDGGGLGDTSLLGDSLLLSFFDLLAQLDLRKNAEGKYDAKRPASGILAAVDTQLGGFFLGGDANDVKLIPELRVYAPIAKRVVLAARLSFGLLFTDNYGVVLDEDLAQNEAPSDCAADQALQCVARDLAPLLKRGLFSGGPSSNRGYGFNEISPHITRDESGTALNATSLDAIGGRTRWEGSIELRFPVVGSLGGVGFIDASDVTRGFGELRFDHPHVSTGLGVRYDTAVGPLRIDFGYQIPYLQVAGEAEPQTCGADTTPCTKLVVDEADGDPFALSIAIGNAF